MHASKSAGLIDRQTAKKRLLVRLDGLQASLRKHDAETSKRLPRDKEEGISARQEIDVLEMAEKAETAAIRRIQAALGRIDKGTYGLCVSCGQPIAKERLRAIPEVDECRICRSEQECQSANGVWPY